MLGTFVGARPYFNDSVAGTKQTVKSGNGKIYAIKILNTTAAAAYLQCFDKLAADVTVGTTAPDFCVPLAASESITVPLTMPVDFATGLVVAGCTSATGSTGAALKVLIVYQ